MSVPNQSMFVSIDGTHYSINEPRPFNKKWYSHKLNGPGLTYEIGLCIRTGQVVWAFGGLPAGDFPDLRMAKMAFVTFLENGEKALADKGYRDSNYFIFPNRDFPDNAQHKRLMARHETINGRMKSFHVLSQQFVRKLNHPKSIFDACIRILQLQMTSGEMRLGSFEQFY